MQQKQRERPFYAGLIAANGGGMVFNIGGEVGAEAGLATVYQLGPASPLNTFSRQWSDAQTDAATETRVAIVTHDQLIASHGLPSCIKIDVEGYELQALQGLHQPIRALSFECNLQQFRQQTLDCITRLASLQPGLFNHYLSEPPSDFASDRWLTADEMAAIVAGTDHDYAEIYFQASGIS